MSQAEGRREIAANRLIEHLMKLVLSQSHGATRVRLALIHDDAGASDKPAGTPRYDVANSVAARGRASGAVLHNQPLSDWSVFLPALLADQCTMKSVPPGEVSAWVAGLRSCKPSSHPTSALICPAFGESLAGALFVLWDGNEPPPPNDLRAVMAVTKRVATQIAAVLALSGRRSLDTSASAPGIPSTRV